MRPQICRFFRAKKKTIGSILGAEHSILKSFDRACGFLKNMKEANFVRESFDFSPLQVELPKQCRLTQLAFRTVENGREVFWINPNLIPYLPYLDVHAIVLHEALHSYFQTSDSTLAVRQFVGMVFADRAFQARNAHLMRELADTKQPIAIDRFR